MIELTSYEAALLKDLLKALGNDNPTLSTEHERFRTDLLFHLPSGR